jgi:ribonuclease HII
VLFGARGYITYASGPEDLPVSKNVEDNLMEMNVFELACQQSGYKQIAGIDEAGRGALAGPVIAAAVILPTHCNINGLRDSKQLSPKQRAHLFDEIHNVAGSIGIGSADHRVIDRLNVLEATLLAMQEAIEKLTVPPDYLLVDGLNLPEVDIVGEAIPKGDSRSYSIAAASIIAKVTRDRLMVELDPIYPNYGFSRHKGYPTSQHRQAIAQFGASDVHRCTFKLLPDV